MYDIIFMNITIGSKFVLFLSTIVENLAYFLTCFKVKSKNQDSFVKK